MEDRREDEERSEEDDDDDDNIEAGTRTTGERGFGRYQLCTGSVHSTISATAAADRTNIANVGGRIWQLWFLSGLISTPHHTLHPLSRFPPRYRINRVHLQYFPLFGDAAIFLSIRGILSDRLPLCRAPCG